jgi:hypothetical protein
MICINDIILDVFLHYDELNPNKVDRTLCIWEIQSESKAVSQQTLASDLNGRTE